MACAVGILARVLPRGMSDFTTEMQQSQGVRIIRGTHVTGALQAPDGRLELRLTPSGTTGEEEALDLSNDEAYLFSDEDYLFNDEDYLSNDEGNDEYVLSDDEDVLVADYVVVAVGVTPNVELARTAKLELDDVRGGIVVNAELMARTDVWAAGDVCSFHDITLGRRREEHHEHAVVSGRLAGANMAGARKHYRHQSKFWSDIGPDIGFEAIGLVDSRLPTRAIFTDNSSAASDHSNGGSDHSNGGSDHSNGGGLSNDADLSNDTSAESGVAQDLADAANLEPLAFGAPVPGTQYVRGVVFYMRDRSVVGVLLWNIFGYVPIARALIRSERKYDDVSELVALFDIYDDPE